MNVPVKRTCLLVLAGALGAALAMRSAVASAQDTPTETPTETATETPTATATPATCPQNLCACLGAAGKFAVAGEEKVYGTVGARHEGAYVEYHDVGIDDSVCATKGRFAGTHDAGLKLAADLILVQSSGIAGRFKGVSPFYLYPYPLNYVGGDLITGGGSLRGAVTVSGATDTTGTSSKVADCRQALADLVNASATFQSLPATQTLAPIKVRSGTTGANYDIYAAQGVNVISVPSIRLVTTDGAYRNGGTPYGAFVTVHLLGTTDSVIVNVAQSLSVAANGGILVDGGDAAKVIINVVGEGAAVSLKRFAQIDPPLLAAQRKTTTRFDTTTGNLFAKTVTARGSQISDELMCP
jgi:choice-of-anchor A domain-containing protein